MHTLRTLGAGFSALAALGAAAPAHAAFTQLTNPGQMYSVSVFSVPDGALGMATAGPISVSSGGNTATFSAGGSGSLFLYDSTGQNTAFADNTPLLETLDAGTALPTGPLTISFAQGVAGFGLFGQGGASTGTTAFTVNAYDGLNLLGTFTTAPVDDNVNPGTAAFLGGVATGPDSITRVTIRSTSTEAGAGDNAIYGPLTVGPAVPESSSLTLAALGLLLLPLLAARRARPFPAIARRR